MCVVWEGWGEFVFPLDYLEDTVSSWGLTSSPLPGLQLLAPVAADLDPGEPAFAKNKKASQVCLQSSKYLQADSTSPTCKELLLCLPNLSKCICLTGHPQLMWEPHLQAHEQSAIRIMCSFNLKVPQTSHISITWELWRTAASQAPTEPSNSKTLQVGIASCFNKALGDSHARSSIRTTVLLITCP